MRRLVFLILTLVTLAGAEDAFILNTHIRMIPKIMALDTQLTASGANSKKILLGIVYDKHRKSTAQEIADSINTLYNGKVGALSFNAVAVSAAEFSERQDIAFAYLINMETASIRNVAIWGVTHSIPTFSYDADYLNLGVLGSIAIERTTIIYLNKKVMKTGKFRFHDSLLQLARYTE